MQWRIRDFPHVGAPNLGGGMPTYDFYHFSQKPHENERILTGGGLTLTPSVPP